MVEAQRAVARRGAAPAPGGPGVRPGGGGGGVVVAEGAPVEGRGAQPRASLARDAQDQTTAGAGSGRAARGGPPAAAAVAAASWGGRARACSGTVARNVAFPPRAAAGPSGGGPPSTASSSSAADPHASVVHSGASRSPSPLNERSPAKPWARRKTASAKA